MNQEAVIAEIIAERHRQDRKWGPQDHPRAFWLIIIMEELGELARATLIGDALNWREEMTQIGALAVAALERESESDAA